MDKRMNGSSTQGIIRQGYRTMHDLVFNSLLEEILSGKLKPGDKLNISDIAQRLGVSRTPVREALTQLTSVGLVENQPHRSPFVKKMSIEEVIELYYIRAALEGIAGRLASRRLTPAQMQRLVELCDQMEKLSLSANYEEMLKVNFEFHSLIYEASGSPRLQDLVLQYYRQCNQYRALVMELPGGFEEVCREHRQILSAFQEGDMEKADQLARQHHMNSARRIARSVGSDIRI
jgi:DNA-binding GntR family transcriptional regulator